MRIAVIDVKRARSKDLALVAQSLGLQVGKTKYADGELRAFIDHHRAKRRESC